MKIVSMNTVNFKRRLKDSEKSEYSSVLKQAKEKAAKGNGKSILIIPAPSLPQSSSNSTGVGNLASEEAQKFVDFAKLYWGINEVQLLPMGHYFSYKGVYPIYSGSSMDLGNQVINLKDFLSEKDFSEVVNNNKTKDRVNFANIVELDSISEKKLKNLYDHITPDLKREFEEYKAQSSEWLEKKSLYRALRELNGTHDYHLWNHTDSNLFNEDIITTSDREKRIADIKKEKAESIEFYKFKNFLAEKSLMKAKSELNSKGIKLNGDMIFGFAYEEEWGEPKAFLKNLKVKEWGFPVLDKDAPEAEKILRQKVDFYAKHYDGIRVDASWAYLTPNIVNKINLQESKLYNGEKFLEIIDNELKAVKGKDYNLDNVMYEFAADYNTQFDIHNYDGSLKQCVKNRVKIYTSEHLSDNWGSAKNFINRNWGEDKFIIGVMNHDSPPIEPNEKQINALSKILNIPKEKLSKTNEFIKAKFAETMRAKNTMLFFLPALGMDNKFQHNSNHMLDWTAKVPENYEDVYFKNLLQGNGFNPMDALEKQFKTQGLDTKEPKLFKKIVKYRKILEENEKTAAYKKIIIGAAVLSLYY